MKRYRVEFSTAAEDDLIRSIVWGVEIWGERATFQWARDFRASVTNLLGLFPLGQPLAPENEFSKTEIRQLVMGRYRVLYETKKGLVNILHIRGAAIGNENI
jgi:plasmid stabilization system protein ParE